MPTVITTNSFTHHTVRLRSHWTGLGCSRGRVPAVEVLRSAQISWRSSVAAADVADSSCTSHCQGHPAGTTLDRWTGTWYPRCWTWFQRGVTPEQSATECAKWRRHDPVPNSIFCLLLFPAGLSKDFVVILDSMLFSLALDLLNLHRVYFPSRDEIIAFLFLSQVSLYIVLLSAGKPHIWEYAQSNNASYAEDTTAEVYYITEHKRVKIVIFQDVTPLNPRTKKTIKQLRYRTKYWTSYLI